MVSVETPRHHLKPIPQNRFSINNPLGVIELGVIMASSPLVIPLGKGRDINRKILY